MARNEQDEPKTFTKEEVQKMVADGASAAAKAAVEALMPAIAAATINAGKGQVPAQGVGHFNRPPVIRCNQCGQDQKACKTNGHTEMVVYPTRYPEFAEWFMGVYINGVRYLSDRPGHKITVPTDSVSGIKTHIQVWEDNERTTKLGKKRRHNSGDVNAPNRNVPYFR
jgi:uncharacterized protein YraI